MTGVHIQWQDRLHAGVIYDAIDESYILLYTCDTTCPYLYGPWLNVYHADGSVTNIPGAYILTGSEDWVRRWVSHSELPTLQDCIFRGYWTQWNLGIQENYAYGIVRLLDRPTYIEFTDDGKSLCSMTITDKTVFRKIEHRDTFRRDWRPHDMSLSIPNGWNGAQVYGDTIHLLMTAVLVDDNWMATVGLLQSSKAFYNPQFNTQEHSRWMKEFSAINSKGEIPKRWEDIKAGDLIDDVVGISAYSMIGKPNQMAWTFHSVMFHNRIGERWYRAGCRQPSLTTVGISGTFLLTPYSYKFTPIRWWLPQAQDLIPYIWDDIPDDSAEVCPAAYGTRIPISMDRGPSSTPVGPRKDCGGIIPPKEPQDWDIDLGMSTAAALSRTRRRRRLLLGLTQRGV